MWIAPSEKLSYFMLRSGTLDQSELSDMLEGCANSTEKKEQVIFVFHVESLDFIFKGFIIDNCFEKYFYGYLISWFFITHGFLSL